MSKNENYNKFQQELTKALNGSFRLVCDERRKYYASGKSKPDISSIDSLISKYINTNTVVTGAISLVPGPLGMAAAIPEIILIIRNQLAMCYDIGVAYGKEKDIDPELLLAVFVYNTGLMGLGLLVMHGSKVVVKRVSLRVMQKIIILLGGKITQRLLKTMISKWLPGVGAAAMALWVRFETKGISEKAVEIFSRDIEYTKQEVDEDVTLLLEDNLELEETFLIDKLKLLINMMKADGKIEDVELEYLSKVAEYEDLKEDDLQELLTNINTKEQFKVDIKKYSKDSIKAQSIVIDLLAIAKSDGNFDIRERVYLKWICLQLGVKIEDVV